ncbi:hypothetical protein [Rubrivivax gelatinosus]|uniref:hypothetical protein n=1 Tax=Rubrivivax gelatinosus TaxID=28068 RepID=UPI0005C15672|nr:hypothetical protein [Rubrivivax gelatinosus]MBG6083153.1 hypothetical protein [Rubrivivax gelatinosus]
MNKLFRIIVACLAALSLGISSVASAAAAPALCTTGGVSYVFFNGVQTTHEQAIAAVQYLKRAHGSATSNGEQIRYEVFYNQTQGFKDFVEVFEQRLNLNDGLQGRFELFFSAMKGGGTWWAVIAEAVPAFANVVDTLAGLAKDAAVTAIAAIEPSTAQMYRDHAARLDNLIIEGKKLLFVAHSQGNLFANVAYAYASGKVSPNSVSVIHIAPATATLHGPHTLADKDLVIQGLGLVMPIPEATTPIPGYAQRPAGVNGKTDFLGHGLLEIYLNPSLYGAARIKSQVDQALASLVAPPALATSGFFSATLTWDGPGDLDLHTFEPGGAQVYYAARTGASGFLDVDNMRANGPEHYYATCDRSALQPGVYRIAVANYSAEAGRTATVQIASWADGVLGTRSVTLGAATRNTPTAMLFDVVVTEEGNGGFSVSLGPVVRPAR